MTTYPTIEEAFKNGTGDVFFEKAGKYVCFSRHDDNIKEMQAKGFTLLNYDTVIKLSLKSNTVASAAAWANAHKAKEKESNLVKSYDNCSNGRDGYYDQFPDAWNNSL